MVLNWKINIMYCLLTTLRASLVILSCIAAPVLYAQDYAVEPAEGWIKPIEVKFSEQIDQNEHSDGKAFLLVDRQWKIDGKLHKKYRHFSTQALNSTGVSDISHISIYFDPAYESITLHNIVAHRNNKTIDKLVSARINLIQQERELEYAIYDGVKTLNIFLEDIRNDDIVEYSYTIEGANPVLSGHFAYNLDLRWGVPVDKTYYRLLWPSGKPLYIKNHLSNIEPLKQELDTYTEYTWALNKTPALITDEDTPDWHSPFPVVYLSDMQSWEEVSSWALPMYQTVKDSSAQKSVIAPMMQENKSDEDRLLAALRFAQEEVRYLGIEMGERSYRPNAPDAVLKQRFGDCKDKSRLLTSLLDEMNIPASTALVNTYEGKQLLNILPTPVAFDHAIVHAKLNGKDYWLDPTLNYQAGNLDALYQPNYKYALLISEDSSKLINMSDDINIVHSKTVEESFDIDEDKNAPTPYTIVTQFNGYYANKTRRLLSESSRQEIEQMYLNYTAHYFPSIKISQPLEVKDDTSLNRLTLFEYYEIPKIWDSESNNNKFSYASFEPFLMDDHIDTVSNLSRTSPYANEHPVKFQHTTKINIPKGVHTKEESFEIEDEAFRFSRTVDKSDGLLSIAYQYESLKDHVQAADIKTYAGNIKAARDETYFKIHRHNATSSETSVDSTKKEANWTGALLIMLAALGFTLGVYKLIHRHTFKQEMD